MKSEPLEVPLGTNFGENPASAEPEDALDNERADGQEQVQAGGGPGNAPQGTGGVDEQVTSVVSGLSVRLSGC